MVTAGVGGDVLDETVCRGGRCERAGDFKRIVLFLLNIFFVKKEFKTRKKCRRGKSGARRKGRV